MKDKDILELLGLTDKKLSLELDIIENMDKKTLEDLILQVIEKDYKVEKKNEDFVNTFQYGKIYKQLKDKMIKDGFIYRCPFCLDVSGEYGRPIETYDNRNHNHNK